MINEKFGIIDIFSCVFRNIHLVCLHNNCAY